MLRAIELDDQTMSYAGEVGDVGADGNLPPEFNVGEPTASQLSPKPLFSICLRAAKTPCVLPLFLIAHLQRSPRIEECD
jgi:hypothetical protein